MRVLLVLAVLFIVCLKSFADCYVPEFDKMQTLRCDFEERVFEQNGTLVTRNNKFRIFHIDDENKKIYLQKEPIDNVIYYEADRIEFGLQSMTDDAIIMSQTVLNRKTYEYNSNSTITYDNPDFGVRNSQSSGICKILP